MKLGIESSQLIYFSRLKAEKRREPKKPPVGPWGIAAGKSLLP